MQPVGTLLLPSLVAHRQRLPSVCSLLCLQVWRPGYDPIGEDEELEYDATAYDCLHRFQLDWPCLRCAEGVRGLMGKGVGPASRRSMCTGRTPGLRGPSLRQQRSWPS